MKLRGTPPARPLGRREEGGVELFFTPPPSQGFCVFEGCL